MEKNKQQLEKPYKWEIVYEDEDTISIWRYNTKKSKYGPIEVEYKYKKGFIQPKRKKSLGDIVKESTSKDDGQ